MLNAKCKSDTIRPVTTKATEIEGMLNSMCAFEISGVNYVACPITGGNLYVEQLLLRKEGTKGSSSRSLIEENIARAGAFCASVREKTSQVCINPSVLHREDWSQDDYRHFWSRVIEMFAAQMYLSRGWQVSTGCLYECLLAIRLELPLFNHEFESFAYAKAVDLALSGITTLKELGESSQFLNVLADQFQELNDSELINGPT